MRRIVAFNHVSADGCFASAAGDLNWVVPDEEIGRAAAQATAGPDNMILFGRHTYEMFERFWPHALDDSPTAPDPHRPGRRSESMRGMAVWINEATKVVVSTTREAVAWKNSRLIRRIGRTEIEALKAEPGHDIMLFGSGTIVSSLTRLRLIDEYQFVVSPVFLGDGRRLLGELATPAALTLLEARPYASGNVMLRYAPQ